jgi:hypothetical protein
MSYYTESLKPRSEKITLVTAEAVERLKLFTSSGADWTRSVEHFVVGVKDNGAVITSWSFDPLSKTLTILGGANPKTRDISVTYRFFFSNAPINLPYDLNTGTTVEWEPYITSIGSIGQQLDDLNTGIVLESSSNVDFINNDGRFDEIFDTLIWENQAIKFYSWFPAIPITEKIQLFDGVIESKDFSESKVSFKVKDFVFKLKNQVSLGTFTDADGEILPSILDTPKRRIYGQVEHCRMVSLDATLEGYTLSGTISTTVASVTLTGVGTLFLSELSVGDEIVTIFNNEEIKLGIQSIESDTSLTLGKEAEVSLVNFTFTNKPKIPYRGRNRSWHIAGHKLRAPSTTITAILGSNVFTVASVADLFSGDEITVNSIQARIRRVSGLTIVTESSISPAPSVSDIIAKRPIQAVYFGKRPLTFNRDYQISNVTEAIITLEDDAEFNLFEQRSLGVSATFTNGSRSIITVSVVDLRSILNPRDWIRSANIAKPDWYEILEVKQQEILIRTPFSGATATETGLIKNVTYIEENSLMTVNCLGMEVDDLWIKTPSDAVRHLVLNDALFATVNEAKFAKAKSDCDYILSMVIPETLGSESPLIRDVITKINESVFGSLYGDSSQNISYSILNATKPELSDIIRDDDILSFSIQASQKIANKVIVNYRPFTDVNSEEDTFLVEEFESDFVDELIGIKNTIEKTLYIYETDKAKIISQRLALFNSLSSANIKIKSKLNLAQVVVNDKIFLSLDRLYKRYGGRDRRKLGTVTGVKRDGYGCEITVSDLSNVYNRVLSIAPNSTLDYSLSSEDNKLLWAYIVDNQTETADPNSETGLGANIIG